jgi:hypothetical protein
MPLQLDSTEPLTGAQGNFWNIDDITMRWQALSADVTMGLYVDAAAHADGKRPLKSVTFTLAKSELDQLALAMGPAVYMVLANRPEFHDAIYVT